MTMIKLIADSGSTKTTWCAVLPHSISFSIQTMGVNPVRDDVKTIQMVVDSALSNIKNECVMGRASSFISEFSVTEVDFYGAGCIAPYSETVRQVLASSFAGARIFVESDLLGAARALCGDHEGIACILGTGSNSCLYDGERIVQNVSPLGWILGDEGSGAVLRRTLVGDLYKGQLPRPLLDDFEARFHLTRTSVIDAVYRQPLPNRFLASLVPFLTEHREDAAIHDFLLRQFRLFLLRNVAGYQRRDLSVNFVGGVSYQFEDELREACRLEGFDVGVVNRSPMDGMVRFHQSTVA